MSFPVVAGSWYSIFLAKKIIAQAQNHLTQFRKSSLENTAMLQYGVSPKKRGRPTINDSMLIGHRDRLAWLLSVAWGDIGWELPRVKNQEQLHIALAPLRGRHGHDVIAIFLRPASLPATKKELATLTREFGKIRKELGKAVDRMHSTFEKHRTYAQTFQQAQAAIEMHRVKDAQTELNLDPQLDEEQRTAMVAEFKKRQTEFRAIETQLASNVELERKLRRELEEKEAAFAQAELLDYIKKGKYARNPLGLANAMAGLPFLKWSQSRSRCAKLKCSGWPLLWFSEVELICDIWKKRESSPELPIVELFRRAIQALPRKTLYYYEPEERNILMPNQLRSRLADHFRLLRLAIEQTLQSNMHPGKIPFAITSMFERNIENPRTAADDLLIAHERIE